MQMTTSTPISEESLEIAGFTMFGAGGTYYFPKPISSAITLRKNRWADEWLITIGPKGKTVIKTPTCMEQIASFYTGCCDRKMILDHFTTLL